VVRRQIRNDFSGTANLQALSAPFFTFCQCLKNGPAVFQTLAFHWFYDLFDDFTGPVLNNRRRDGGISTCWALYIILELLLSNNFTHNCWLTNILNPDMKLEHKEILLGVSGGIAAYKSPEIIRGIKEAGGQVSVIMTQAAMAFIQPLVLQTLSERPVATSLFSLSDENRIGHIQLTETADAMLIAPATANIIGKAAHGIADDYLSTALLACPAPVFIAPAMNHHMWDHPAVQTNINTLTIRGVQVIAPESGFLACGAYGTGRMAGPDTIVGHLIDWFDRNERPSSPVLPLSGVEVMVTAGPTRERIDAVRYLSNDSSGKMGYALAGYCRRLGATVHLISGPTSLPSPDGVETVRVISAEDMYQAVMAKADRCRLIIKAAAVSDYRVENPNAHKTKKKDSWNLTLVKNPDILKALGTQKREGCFLVGFAAESDNIMDYARQKLIDKHLDLVVANNILQPDAGFNVDTNRVWLIDDENALELPLLSKDAVAERIVDHILKTPKWQAIKPD
jgi:phosphopantothenoylcysteine decarboxylase / phosphopantothenate---cysteine ligase